MKVEELMIGDWVLYEGKPIIVENVYDDCINYTPYIPYVQKEYFIEVNNIQPISLTVEILEKNGFKKDKKNENMYYWNWGIIEDCVSYDKETGKVRIFKALGNLVFVRPLGYVHELQHALKLCGIEKEITL